MIKTISKPKKFISLEHMKRNSEFFPKGKIIPARILKTDRKQQHKLKFGADAWCINTSGGYICLTHQTEEGCAIRISHRYKSLDVCGSPYRENGDGTRFQGDLGLDYFEFLEKLNNLYISKNSQES